MNESYEFFHGKIFSCLFCWRNSEKFSRGISWINHRFFI